MDWFKEAIKQVLCREASTDLYRVPCKPCPISLSDCSRCTTVVIMRFSTDNEMCYLLHTRLFTMLEDALSICMFWDYWRVFANLFVRGIYACWSSQLHLAVLNSPCLIHTILLMENGINLVIAGFHFKRSYQILPYSGMCLFYVSLVRQICTSIEGTRFDRLAYFPHFFSQADLNVGSFPRTKRNWKPIFVHIAQHLFPFILV
jgi:hypothetical protein